MTVHARTAPLTLATLLFTATGALTAQVAPSQPSQQTFRSSADYVQVSLQAHDRNGRQISDLSRADLQLFEDGKLQDIA